MMGDVMRRLLVVAGMAACIRLLFMIGMTG